MPYFALIIMFYHVKIACYQVPFGERVHCIDPYESLNGIIPNCQSG